MGLLVTPLLVLVLDEAWTSSTYCAGEWALFLQSAMRTYTEAGSDPQAKYAMKFHLVVEYHTSEASATADARASRSTLRDLVA